MQPVIRRELRAASRRRETWRLRLIFGAGALGAALFGLLLPDVSNQQRGQVVLVCMAICGFTMSVLAGAYVTADALSSEKREGTLGLLFLTPLNGWEIVLGKMFTHSLQVKYAVLGGFPLLFLPLLLGGVLWVEVGRIVLVILLTLLLSLACGVFWSAVGRESRTVVLATAVTMMLLTLLPWLWVLLRALIGHGLRLVGLPQVSPMTALVLAFESNYRLSFGPRLGTGSGGSLYWGSVACSLVCGALFIGLSGWLLPRFWRRGEERGGLPQSRAASGALARSWLPAWAPALDAAPLVWLAARRSSQALWVEPVRWGIVLLVAFMLLVSITTRYWQAGFIFGFSAAFGLHLLTRIELALASTRRLHDEWRSGTLEILLTTPVAATDLLRAHHQSLKHAFRLRLALLLAINALLETWVILFPKQLHLGRASGIFSAFFIGGAVVTLADFAALRWLGLRESLRSPTSLKATGRTFARLMIAPWILFAPTFLVAVGTRDEGAAAMVFSVWYAGCILYDNLLINSSRRWLGPGLRRRVSESGTAGISST